MATAPASNRIAITYEAPPNVAGPLAVTLIDLASGHVWSPSAGGYVPTSNAPTDTLFPLSLVGGPNHPTTWVGVISNGPPAPASGSAVLVYPHPAAGGPPVDAPLTLQQSAASSPRFQFAVVLP